MKVTWLVLVALVPLGAWLYTCLLAPRYMWRATGAAFGLVIYPLSLGLAAISFESWPTQLIGVAGIVSMFFHSAPALLLEFWLNPLPSDESMVDIYIALFDGVLWAAVYGYIGLRVDRARLARSRSVL